MKQLRIFGTCALALAALVSNASAADYSKRVMALDASITRHLIGKWTNPVDHVIVEITNVDPTSGAVTGKEWPTTGLAKGDEHDLVGWINAAPLKDGYDNVVPVTFSTTMYEYGTLPSWAGFLRGDSLVTMHYLVWPNRPYSWDHISTFQETWTRMP